ncbi:MAG: hypothetical protein WAT39_10965 [Planctomycetota bacterium]
MRIHLALFVVLSPALSLLSAQIATTAHPQETLQNGNGILGAFGAFPTGLFAEARTQILVPKDELPALPALLTAIEVHCQNLATLDYTALDLQVAPCTATVLSPTFATNFASPPTPVLQGPRQIAWSGTGFTMIPFTVPYVHDGTSGLVIDIQKTLLPATSYPFATMSTSSSPPRADRPNMIYTLGLSGSGAATAAVAPYAAVALVVRLVWAGTPTVRLRSNLGVSGNQFSLGSAVTMTLNGPPGHFWLLAAALSFLPTAVPLPGILGDLRLSGPVVFASGLLDPSGAGVLLVNIPANPGLAGAYLAYQGAAVDPVNVAITLSNGTDHFINP